MSMSTIELFFNIGLGLIALSLLRRILTSRSSASLPPGPKGLPIIGNLFDMPRAHEWRTFAEWGERWGSMVHVDVLGQRTIILNSLQAAIDLLDKRSAIYSDRPYLLVAGELVGWDKTMALMQYGEQFREHRRMLHRLLGTTANIERFFPIEEQETHRFLRRVLQQPDSVAEQIRRTAGAIILMISHGYQVKGDKDPFVTTAEQAVEEFSRSTEPGAFLVDVLPILRYVPDWLPGSGWRRTANAWAADLARMADAPHDFVKRQMTEGKALPSFTSTHLEKHLTPEQEFNVKWAAADIYSGGADTTVSAIHSFFLAMTLHPELQRKAQLEIDAVIGHDRLPSLKDRANLPYVDALVKECLRWYPVSNLGVPHRVVQDDAYNGYLIPKGTYVIANLWKFMHDPEVYRNPHDFYPDRYIASDGKEGEPDPRALAFGFGRRICPGIKLADTSLWISCAMSLAAFDISKKVLDGRVIEPVVDYQSGTISHPKPFECSIKARSEKSLELINSIDLLED